MREIRSITGLRVITASEAAAVGAVDQVVVDLAQGKVLGLILGDGIAERGVAAADIQTIGADVIMVSSESVAKPLSELPELEKRRSEHAASLPVFTAAGRRLGVIAGIFIDPLEKTVARWEVSGGPLKDLAEGILIMPVIPGTVHGQDAVIVPDDSVQELARETGGLRARLGQWGDTARKQVEQVSETVTKQAKQVAESAEKIVDKSAETLKKEAAEVREKAAQVGATVTKQAKQAVAGAEKVVDKSAETLREQAAEVRERAQHVTETVTKSAENLREQTAEVRERAADLSAKAREAVLGDDKEETEPTETPSVVAADDKVVPVPPDEPEKEQIIPSEESETKPKKPRAKKSDAAAESTEAE